MKNGLVSISILCFLFYSAHSSSLPNKISFGDSAKPLTALWTFKTEGSIYSSACYDNSSIYFGSEDHHVYALDARTGKKKWAFKTGGAVSSSPVISGKKLFVLSMDGLLYALDVGNGKSVWTFKTGGETRLDIWDYYLSSPVVNNGIVYFGSSDNKVYAINEDTGQLIWTFITGNIVHADPLVKNDTLYIGSFDGWMYALHAKTGKSIWKFQTVGDQYFPRGEIQKGAAIHGNSLFAGSRDYNIYALNSATGRGKWNMKEKGSWIVATPLYSDGKLYFGTSDSHMFYCMDAGSGDIIWKLPLNMRVYGTAVQNENVIYFGCFNGKLYGVDALTGVILSSFQSNASKKNYYNVFDKNEKFRNDFQMYGPQFKESETRILSLGSFLATPVVHNGILYTGASDGYFYALRL